MRNLASFANARRWRAAAAFVAALSAAGGPRSAPPAGASLPLSVASIVPDKSAPQRALVADVVWSAQAAGGAGARACEFWIEPERGRPALAQAGPAMAWTWTPRSPGRYRVRVVVTDGGGNKAETRSEPYEILPALADDAAVAILPVENLSGAPAPLAAIREGLRAVLAARSIPVLDDGILERFMAAHRMRYTGGLASELGKVLLDETGAAAVLVTSVDLSEETETPRFALTSRLVSTGGKTAILWMDSGGAAGDEHPGLLDLHVVRDAETLRKRVIARVGGGAAARIRELETLEAPELGKRASAKARFRPRTFYRSRRPAPTGPAVRYAVMPFVNDTARKSAGDLVALQFVRRLAGRPEIEVVEPGVVREVLLQTRLVQSGGISLAQADVLRELLDVDMVVTGRVAEWEDPGGGGATPRVAFSSRGIDTRARQVVWTATSGNRGDQGVFFFGRGRITTAETLASEAVLGVVERAVEAREK
jgi:hypothetical protein